MSKKLLDAPERNDRDRKRDVRYEQGDGVYCKHLGLWSRGTFISYNKDNTIRVRLSRKERADLKPFDVAPTKR